MSGKIQVFFFFLSVIWWNGKIYLLTSSFFFFFFFFFFFLLINFRFSFLARIRWCVPEDKILVWVYTICQIWSNFYLFHNFLVDPLSYPTMLTLVFLLGPFATFTRYVINCFISIITLSPLAIPLRINHFCFDYYYFPFLRVFHTNINWCSFTRVWVTADFLSSPRLYCTPSLFFRPLGTVPRAPLQLVSLPQLIQLSGKIQIFVYLFAFFYFHFVVRRNSKIHQMTDSFFLVN